MVIGIDVGTTGTKAAVVGSSGKLYGLGYRGYETAAGADGRSEQEPADWWEACAAAVREALASVNAAEVSALAVSAQGASSFAAGPGAEPLMPAMTWMDTRAAGVCAELSPLSERVYEACGWQLGPMGDLAKLVWLRRNARETFERAETFLSTLEYINCRLTGQCVADETSAAMRQLYDIRAHRWDPELLAAAGTDARRLPRVLPAGALLGTLSAEAAEALGLSKDVKVYNGAHDQYCAALASGTVRPGELLLATGTAWVMLGVTEQPLFSELRLAPGVHPAAGRFGNMGSLLGMGSALKWLKNVLGEAYAELDAGAEGRRESAKDLFFYPYFNGAGFPRNAPAMRAAVYGLSLHHEKSDLARALMEGAAFEARAAVRAFADSGADASVLRMTGGATSSGFWTQLVADVTGLPIEIPEGRESCCCGAAMIALKGEKVYNSYEDAIRACVRFRRVEPRPEEVALYAEKAKRYEEILEERK